MAMNKTFLLIIILLYPVVNSCERDNIDNKNEAFIGDFKYIYGSWRHVRTEGGWTGGAVSSDEYYIRFSPNAKFSYNEGKTGIIKIIEQKSNFIHVDFNSLYPGAGSCNLFLHGHDTLTIGDIGADMSTRHFVRSAK
jgi:hypothetical protein